MVIEDHALAEIELHPDTIFIVECSAPLCDSTWVECNSAESAYLARWQLQRDVGMMGTKIRITNVITGQIVLNQF